jgi:hypothetical protein
MPTPPTANLGYGQQTEATIDQANIAMRAMPWYQEQMRQWGQDPGHPNLAKSQSQQILKLAQGHGYVVDEGNMEVDDHGNFNPVGHKLRNTLIVVGIAAATIATMGAAGAFSAAAGGSSAAAGAGGAGTLAATATVPTVGALAAGGTGLAAAGGTAAAAGGAAAVGGTTAATIAGTGAAAKAGMSYADLLKYGAPVAGNLVGGLIQANAAGKASDAQQKYLEEALAYQKESDAYARTTDAARYADTRGDVAKADQRYGDYQGRILPFIQNGTSSNDRMAALLGLPARAGGGSSSGGSSSGPPASQGVKRDAVTDAAVDAALKANNSSDDPEYWKNQIAAHGDSSTKSWAYWKDFIARGDGVGKGYAGPSVPATAAASPATAPPPAAPVTGYTPTNTDGSGLQQTTQPQARSAAPVQMRAPDGSVQSVPADQVDHYTKLGATLLGAAA